MLEMTWRYFLLVRTLDLFLRTTSAYVVNTPVPTVTGRDTTPPAWVTVQSNGAAETIIPSTDTTGTGSATESAPPAYLTLTAAWTLTVDNTATTSTGLSPVATAAGPGAEGSFLSCDNSQRHDTPFCQPKDGSTLTSGHVYYVTWDSSYFSADDISIQVEGDYGNGMGFASETLDGKRGFYAWNVTDELAQEVKENNSTLLVALSIVIVNSSSVDTGRREKGPTVILTQADSKGPESSNIGVLIVVLPSFLGIALLVVAGAIWVINRRRRGASFVPSWLASFIGSTKGARSRTQLPDRSTTVSPGINKRNPQYDIQLTERDSWSATSLGREPHPGRNVFRDEMARQNRDRG